MSAQGACILGAVLSFHHFGSVSIPDLLGIGFIALGVIVLVAGAGVLPLPSCRRSPKTDEGLYGGATILSACIPTAKA